MTEIPEDVESRLFNMPDDVKDAACEAYNSPPHELWKMIPSFYRDEVLETLALAIIAERERCSIIARTLGVYPELNVSSGGPEWYKHAQAIADAIKQPSSVSSASPERCPSEQERDLHQQPCISDEA